MGGVGGRRGGGGKDAIADVRAGGRRGTVSFGEVREVEG